MSPIHALLGLLWHGERHGYDCKRAIDGEFAPFWQIDFAQLYRSLAKMQARGWIKVRVEPGLGGPERKMYALTPRGRQAFEAWLPQPTADRNEFLVKLRLARMTGVGITPLVDAQRQALERELAVRHAALAQARQAGDAGSVILADTALRETQASLAAIDLWTATSPQSRGTGTKTPPENLVITGSDDPLLTYLAQLNATSTSAVGSLGGLLVLARREADVAGVHLLDLDTGEYNVPFIKHILPEQPAVLVNLAFRENGLMIARGNPKQIRGVRDLTRGDVRFINRGRGTGTRLLLYARLQAARIDPQTLPGWEHAVATHEGVAAAIASNTADVGPGLAAVAMEWGLDFVPLGEERYDLVIPAEVYNSQRVQPLLDAIHSAAFRHKGAGLYGYDLGKSGRIVARIK